MLKEIRSYSKEAQQSGRQRIMVMNGWDGLTTEPGSVSLFLSDFLNVCFDQPEI